MLFDLGCDFGRDFFDGLIPRDLMPFFPNTLHRMKHAVRAVLSGRPARAFDAGVAFADDMLFVGSNIHDAIGVGIDVDLKAAGGFTNSAERDLRLDGHSAGNLMHDGVRGDDRPLCDGIRCLNLRKLLFNKRANPVDGRLCLREHACEGVPDVNHVVPLFEGRRYAGLSSCLVESSCIVEQGFRRSDVNEKRRESREIGEERRCKWCLRILPGEVCVGAKVEQLPRNHRVRVSEAVHGFARLC